MTNKIKIEKHAIGPRTHTLSAKWSVEEVVDSGFFCPILPKPVSKMTKHEEADEIVRRLSTPPRTQKEIEIDIDALMSTMAAEISKEIDNEMLEKIREVYAKDRS